MALGGSAVAAAYDAGAVLGGQGAPLGSGDGPAEAAQVQLFAVGAEVDGADVGAAEQPEQFFAGEQAVPVTEQVGRFGAGQAGEGAGGRQDGDLGAAAALLGQVQSGAVGSVRQDLVQGVVPASAGAAGVAVSALPCTRGSVTEWNSARVSRCRVPVRCPVPSGCRRR